MFVVQRRPDFGIVLLAVAFSEGGLVSDGAFDGAGGEGGVGHGAGDGAAF